MRPERWPFFYGWVIVGAAFVASGIGSGAAIWGPSVLLLPMTEDLGWSRAEFFSAFLVRELLIGLAAPLVGPFYDSKRGPRILALVGAVLLGLSMVLIRHVTELWQFIALFGVLGGVAELGGGFFISQALVPKWFVRKRGRALGISVMGAGLGALLFPTGVSALIEAVGWRDAWLWFGVAVGSIAFLLGLFLRTKPEDSGMLPDGGPSREALSHGAAPFVEERSLTRREAVRTPAFWLLLAAFSLVGLGITGFQSNWHPFLVETGFTPGQAAAGIAVYGLLSGIVRPGWGLLGERFPARYLLGGVSISTAVLIAIFLNVRTMEVLLPVMFMAGVIMGGYLILRALLTANYFGRTYLGAVNSLFRPIVMGTGAAGPLLFGALYDLEGGYTLAFLAAALAWGAAGVIVLLAKPPHTR
ncbi:MAG: MFS transporter [Chloroflexi bacterium]|nr:MFS transporter [Chloroflexota bacterium]